MVGVLDNPEAADEYTIDYSQGGFQDGEKTN